MRKKILATAALMLTVATLCFAITTRRRLECASEGYSYGYSYGSSTVYGIRNAPSYYDAEEKNAWVDGANRGRSDKKNGRDYDDPYMKQLQTSCFD
ncbi:MAG: hypothetical protein K6B43_02870 [Treponema sp.]|nr:hypothetical protein [Treponema sp.]